MQQPPPRPGPGRPGSQGPPMPPGPQRMSTVPGPGGPQRMTAPPGPGGPQYMEQPGQYGSFPPMESADLTKKEKKKKKKECKKKKKKKDSDSESDSDDNSCECPPVQPTTQIFINQGGPQEQSNIGAEDGCPSCLTWEQWCQQCTGNGVQKGPTCCPTSTKKQKGKKNCSPMVCCPMDDPAQHFVCCPSQNKGKEKKCESGNGGKSKNSLEGMMPATQQFLMFLQAYGLAAALIRDRCNRNMSANPSQYTAQPASGVPVINIPYPSNQQQQPDSSNKGQTNYIQCIPFQLVPSNNPPCPPCPPCPEQKKESKPKTSKT